MKNGYKIQWTDHALIELGNTLKYLEENFSKKEIQKLAQKTESIINFNFPESRIIP